VAIFDVLCMWLGHLRRNRLGTELSSPSSDDQPVIRDPVICLSATQFNVSEAERRKLSEQAGCGSAWSYIIGVPAVHVTAGRRQSS